MNSLGSTLSNVLLFAVAIIFADNILIPFIEGFIEVMVEK